MLWGVELSFGECMKLEYWIVFCVLEGVDFFEGVRVVFVDRDNVLKWRLVWLEDIDMDDLILYF